MSPTAHDWTKEKFEYYTVLRRDTDEHKGSGVWWLVLCACGHVVAMRTDALMTLHDRDNPSRCLMCIEADRYGISRRIWTNIELRAREDHREFTITLAELAWLFYVTQNECCAHCGLKLTVFVPLREKDGAVINASPDRIDSTKGYIPGNIQWVYIHSNLAKQRLTDNEYNSMCLANTLNFISKKTPQQNTAFDAVAAATLTIMEQLHTTDAACRQSTTFNDMYAAIKHVIYQRTESHQDDLSHVATPALQLPQIYV